MNNMTITSTLADNSIKESELVEATQRDKSKFLNGVSLSIIVIIGVFLVISMFILLRKIIQSKKLQCSLCDFCCCRKLHGSVSANANSNGRFSSVQTNTTSSNSQSISMNYQPDLLNQPQNLAADLPKYEEFAVDRNKFLKYNQSSLSLNEAQPPKYDEIDSKRY